MAGTPSDAFFDSVLRALPEVDYAVAYGSGVFPQEGGFPQEEGAVAPPTAVAPADTMVDFLLAVSDPLGWHAANLRLNGSHYSALGALGPRAVTAVQRCGGGRVYFNTLVPHSSSSPPLARVTGAATGAAARVHSEHRLIKYGVIDLAHLRADLLGWETLYVSGRLHKPVRTLVHCAKLEPALRANQKAALAAGLLSLPARFTERELYSAIASLSYAGDVRMGIAEDPRKVEKLVLPPDSFAKFGGLYAHLLATDAPGVARGAVGGEWTQCTGAATTAARLCVVPPRVRAHVLANDPRVGPLAADALLCAGARPTAALEAAVARTDRASVQLALRTVLAQTVRSASVVQSLKGLLTAGAAKSALYVARKLRKARG
ncbi:mitochondrial matrix Mmp37 [Pavlovales sp. CCMP2436]|nr:mitochondrial matrix Mmp37 [Pavlovales sp. CCMP2436]